MATPNVSLSGALNQQTKTGAASNKLADDFSQFLQLLTIQLQHQDPLSPMDTTEFTNQLVNFSQVEQQINTNQKLDNLVAMNLNNAVGSSLSYVGMDISYLSSEVNYTGEPTKITYALDAPSVTTKIQVVDESGKVVYQTDGEKDTGKNEFTWDGTLTTGGKAEPGTYEIKVAAFDQDDNAIKSSVVVSGRVQGVETQDGIINLIVGERAVPVSNILNVKKPSLTTPSTT